MSRRGGRDDLYDDRGGYYAEPPPPPRSAPPVRTREVEEVDVRYRRGDREDTRDRQPEFLRRQQFVEEDQPLVLRKREIETFTRPVERRSPSPVERERTRTRIVTRERERSPSPQIVERTRTKVVERERERERGHSPPELERFSGARATRVVYDRSMERERSPEMVERSRTRFVEREREIRPPSPPPSDRIRTTTRITERARARSISPSVAEERIEITTRTRRRSPSIASSASPPPVLEPPIIRAPPIHQEIITHHRHIDHGYDYEPRLAPVPPRVRTPPREKEKEVEIDIHTGRHGTDIDIYKSKREVSPPRRERERREFYDDDVLIERDRDRVRVRDSHIERRRSLSTRPHQRIHEDQTEADFYARKVEERAYIGEAFNGATKDWAIVDVPPGTERVRMDGVGGGSQEVSWQRYNGVRRSKFLPERDTMAIYEREEVDDRRVGRPLPPPKNRYGDMWTEITKDLVVREAIEEFGYDFEETEFFFYVIQFLRYEDVQELVDLSEHIRKERRNRIREIAHEKEHMHVHVHDRDRDRRRDRERRMLPEYEDERIIEREIIYDGPHAHRPRGYLR